MEIQIKYFLKKAILIFDVVMMILFIPNACDRRESLVFRYEKIYALEKWDSVIRNDPLFSPAESLFLKNRLNADNFPKTKTICDRVVLSETFRYESAKKKAYEIAESLVGMPGDCFYIVSLFSAAYLGPGHSLALAYVVEDPMPGDLIYYYNGGIGYEHWAIYLDEDTALQGNYNGYAIIGKVYLYGASEPVFMRVP